MDEPGSTDPGYAACGRASRALKLAPYAISVVLLVTIALYSDGFRVATRARWDWLALAVAMSLGVNIGLAAFKLWVLLRAYGLPVALGRVVRMIAGLLPATFFMPFQSGHLLYPAALKGGEAIDTVVAFECIAFDKYLTLMGTFVLVLAGWLLLPGGHFLKVFWVPLAAVAAVSTLWLGRPIRAVMRRLKILRERSMVLDHPLGTPRKLALLGMAAVYQATDMTTMYLACRALGIDIDPMLVFGAFPVLLLLTYAPVTISGLGVREPLVALFFAGAMKPDLGIGVGLLIDLVEYAIPALVGIVALPPLLRALRASFGRTHP